jgi:hypothetical protein
MTSPEISRKKFVTIRGSAVRRSKLGMGFS